MNKGLERIKEANRLYSKARDENHPNHKPIKKPHKQILDAFGKYCSKYY